MIWAHRNWSSCCLDNSTFYQNSYLYIASAFESSTIHQALNYVCTSSAASSWSANHPLSSWPPIESLILLMTWQTAFKVVCHALWPRRWNSRRAKFSKLVKNIWLNNVSFFCWKPLTSDYIAQGSFFSEKWPPIFLEAPNFWLRCSRLFFLFRNMAPHIFGSP